MSWISTFAWALFPSAALLIALLLLPVWGAVRKAVLRLVDNVLFFKIALGPLNVPLYWGVIGIVSLTLLGSTHEVTRLQDKYDDLKSRGKHDEFTTIAKFRAERNWWLVLFALSLWLIVFKIREHLQRIHNLEEQLHAARVSLAQPKAVSTTTAAPTTTAAAAAAGAAGGSPVLAAAPLSGKGPKLAAGDVTPAVASAPPAEPDGDVGVASAASDEPKKHR